MRRLAAIRWRRTTAAGVTVLVSPAYASDTAAATRWADFFNSLLHGSELGLLRAYIAPLDEVQDICGDYALGCYGPNRLVTVGDSSAGVPPVEVAAHEYGHHVAYNRVNPPWRAVDWGPKRWASAMNVCSRVAAQTAYPGDEGANYTLNPGEAFAESYRLLTGYGVNNWDIVDPSFHPSAEALEALRADVLQPWTDSTTETLRVAKGRQTWTHPVTTPLDGTLSITSRSGADLQLLGDGGRVVAKSSWAGGGGKSIEYQVCGARSLTVRVKRPSAAPQMSLRITRP